MKNVRLLVNYVVVDRRQHGVVPEAQLLEHGHEGTAPLLPLLARVTRELVALEAVGVVLQHNTVQMRFRWFFFLYRGETITPNNFPDDGCYRLFLARFS